MSMESEMPQLLATESEMPLPLSMECEKTHADSRTDETLRAATTEEQEFDSLPSTIQQLTEVSF